MTEAEIPDGLRLCRASGWNQQEQDWRLLLRLASGRFQVAIDDGRVVATGGAAVYGSRLAWICMILVEPEARGRGIGTEIFKKVLGALDDIEIVGLDATPAGRRVYSKLGFSDADALVRMGARAQHARRRDAGAARPVERGDLDAICALDRDVFGANRSDVLAWALEEAPGYAWRLDDGGLLAGYCFGRHGSMAEYIGPVIARSTDAALELVSASLANAQGDCVIDVPEERVEWLAALQRLGFEAQRPLTRMYRGTARWLGQPEQRFAIGGPELG